MTHILHPPQKMLRHEWGRAQTGSPERLGGVDEHMRSSGEDQNCRVLDAPLGEPGGPEKSSSPGVCR